MDIAALDVSREELVEHLRALRRFSRGVVKAYVTLVCHSPACAVQDVRIAFMERHRIGVRPLQNPLRCKPRHEFIDAGAE